MVDEAGATSRREALAAGSVLGGRFRLSRVAGGDEESEDYTAYRLDEPGFARVRVYLPSAALERAVAALAGWQARVRALGLPFVPEPLGGGFDEATGRVWAASAWVNGKPAAAAGEWTFERAREALDTLAGILDPVRARGVCHGRLAPERLVQNFGTTFVPDLAESAWLGEALPRGGGGDVGELARALRALLGEERPTAAFAHWVAKCEADPPAFATLAAALAAVPTPPTVERTRAQEAREALARANERERERRLRAEEAERARAVRAGEVAPADVPAAVSGADWPAFFARVAALGAPVSLSFAGGSATAEGFAWTVPDGARGAEAWQLARTVAEALRALEAPGAARLGEAASPSYEVRRAAAGSTYLEPVNEPEAKLLRAAAERLRLTPASHPRGGRPFAWDRASARVQAEWGELHFGRLFWGWAGAHEQGLVAHTVLHVRLSRLPSDPARAAAVIDLLLRAAGASAHEPGLTGGTCRFCGRAFGYMEKHDESCCQTCAVARLGVVY